MKKIYGTYANGFMVQLSQPITAKENTFIEEQFDRGFKKIEIYDDTTLETVFEERRENTKRNIYCIKYSVRFNEKKNGKVRTKAQRREIFICADTEAEALSHFSKVTKGQCFYYPKHKAENIQISKVETAEAHTPCLIAT